MKTVFRDFDAAPLISRQMKIRNNFHSIGENGSCNRLQAMFPIKFRWGQKLVMNQFGKECISKFKGDLMISIG